VAAIAPIWPRKVKEPLVASPARCTQSVPDGEALVRPSDYKLLPKSFTARIWSAVPAPQAATGSARSTARCALTWVAPRMCPLRSARSGVAAWETMQCNMSMGVV
jgi:hypothetical protein